MFENPRRAKQARNFTTNVPKSLDLKSSSEQIFSEMWRWVPLSVCHGAKPMSLCYFIDMITPFGCQIIFVSFFLWIAYSELPAFLVKEGGLNSGKHFVSLLPPLALHVFPSALLWQIPETVFLLCLILDGYFSRSPFLQVSWWRTVLRRLWVRLMIYTCLFHLLTLSFSSPEKL